MLRNACGRGWELGASEQVPGSWFLVQPPNEELPAERNPRRSQSAETTPRKFSADFGGPGFVPRNFGCHKERKKPRKAGLCALLCLFWQPRLSLNLQPAVGRNSIPCAPRILWFKAPKHMLEQMEMLYEPNPFPRKSEAGSWGLEARR